MVFRGKTIACYRKLDSDTKLQNISLICIITYIVSGVRGLCLKVSTTTCKVSYMVCNSLGIKVFQFCKDRSFLRKIQSRYVVNK